MIKVAITPDGKNAVSISNDKTITVWDLENGEEKIVLKGHDNYVNAVAITPNGNYAVSGSDDKTLKVWDIEQGVIVSNFIGDNSFRTCDISPDGKSVVASDSFGRMYFLRLEILNNIIPKDIEDTSK